MSGLKICHWSVVWWSMTFKTVSGPAELSLPLFHPTSNFYEKRKAFFSTHTTEIKTSLFLCPIPLKIFMCTRQ